MSKVKLNKQIQEVEGLNSKSAFMVLILAILLLTEHPPADSDGAFGLSELYQSWDGQWTPSAVKPKDVEYYVVSNRSFMKTFQHVGLELPGPLS
ncbi:hypothetical protein APSETT444_006007 [Aspergillus pseudonomiae]